MPHTQRHDFLSGLLFSILGIAFAWGASAYPVGSAARMQTGYFPVMLGGALAVVGLALTLRAIWRDRRSQGRALRTAVAPVEEGNAPPGGVAGNTAAGHWRPVIFVLGANLLFGVLLAGLPALGLPSLGMLVAVPALVATASLAQTGASWREVVWLSLILTLGSYLMFVHLLGLQIPVWPEFLLH
ncbi:tripartite tricarboxylate transporter TctB family protein [Hydrogenophaga sp. 5NK40-0174]|uniref:tripartite tricarboxylate transporter TctB family protein n=1 Tax=Hydrogenophaga sp. 5NK40-0174 TaxID=3127649 RepID=UPI00310242B6